jgi:hypothetical protein
MANKFQQGNKAYIVDNARFLREVIILRVTRDFCTIRYIDSRTIIKIRTSRLYANKKEAEQSIPFSARPKSSNWEYYFNH